jgi:recombinational DNA repair protein RecR
MLEGDDQYSHAILASPEKYEERLSICSKCENLKDLYVCGLCGCFMKIKAKFDGFKCVIDKW